jgi:uncharacterized membrane protein YdbT with pleckstrin-like domain
VRLLFVAQKSHGQPFFRPIILLIFLIWLSSRISEFVVFLVVVFSIFIIIYVILSILTTEFALSDRRILGKKGIIKQQTMQILLGKVESIKISQPFDGRLFGFGTVTVIGTGGSEEYFKSIINPYELQK